MVDDGLRKLTGAVKLLSEANLVTAVLITLLLLVIGSTFSLGKLLTIQRSLEEHRAIVVQEFNQISADRGEFRTSMSVMVRDVNAIREDLRGYLLYGAGRRDAYPRGQQGGPQ